MVAVAAKASESEAQVIAPAQRFSLAQAIAGAVGLGTSRKKDRY
jgi:hypothetical protein